MEPINSNATDIAITSAKIDLEIGFHIPYYIESRLHNKKTVVGTAESTIFIISIVRNNPLIPICQPTKTDSEFGQKDEHLG